MSYIPFGYELVSDCSGQVESGVLSTYFDVNPFRYYDEGESYASPTSSIIVDREIQLPIIYAVWPIERPIPEDIQHEIISTVSLRAPIIPVEETRYPLILRTYDSFQGKYVHLKNIKVRISYSGLTADQYTDDSGFVKIYTGLASITSPSQIQKISLSVITENSKLSICQGSSSTPYQKVLGTIGSLWPSTPNTLTMDLTSTKNEYDIYRACDYYYSSPSSLSSKVLSEEENPIVYSIDRIRFNPDLYGITKPSSKAVYIVDAGLSQPEEIAVVLHELGHIRKYYHQGASEYNNSDRWTIESYSCFLGAYLGEEYYISQGFSKPSSSYLINTMGQQHSWTIGSMSEYSPFFVDLYDDYNQSSYNASIPDDEIESVPVAVVDSLGIFSKSQASSKSTLTSFTGKYFTSDQLSRFLSNH